jgi:hypothetical protein
MVGFALAETFINLLALPKRKGCDKNRNLYDLSA